MINVEQLLSKFFEEIREYDHKEFEVAIKKALEDSKDSWMFDEENEDRIKDDKNN